MLTDVCLCLVGADLECTTAIIIIIIYTPYFGVLRLLLSWTIRCWASLHTNSTKVMLDSTPGGRLLEGRTLGVVSLGQPHCHSEYILAVGDN